MTATTEALRGQLIDVVGEAIAQDLGLGPGWNSRIVDALLAGPIATLTRDRDEAREALGKINTIRDSIIGLQTMDWSEHVYPLVAALDAAGLEGMDYPEARENFGTTLERAVAAEDRIAALEAALTDAEAVMAKSIHPKPDVEPDHPWAVLLRVREALMPERGADHVQG